MHSVVEYDKLRDKILLSCCGLMYSIVLFCYILEWLKGARTFIYIVCLSLVLTLPFIFLIDRLRKKGLGQPDFKYLCTGHFLLFYTFAILTSSVSSTWGYILPLLCIVVMYADMVLVIMCTIVAVLDNIGSFVILSNMGMPLMMNEIEQRLGAIILGGVFMTGACYIIKGYNQILSEFLKTTSIDKVTGFFYVDSIKVLWGNTLNEKKQMKASFMVLDVDDFVYYVDNYGVDFANKVMRVIADTLRDVLSDYSGTSVCKLAADGVGIMFEGRTRNEMYALAKLIAERIGSIVLSPKDEELVLAVSISVTDTDACDVANIKEMVERGVEGIAKARVATPLHIYIDDRQVYKELE